MSHDPCCSFSGGGRHSNPVLVDEALLVAELNQLTVHERERVYEEVHGVACDYDEHPENIGQFLSEMRAELAKVPQRKRRTFDRALFLRPSLATDDNFFLMFLRAERFDAAGAAKRMCQYFDYKLELFGEDKLVKKITLDDLNEDDMAAMRTGAVHVLPNTDQVGRTILFINLSQFFIKDWQSMARYCYYQVMAMLEDDNAQTKGVVEVLRFVGMGNNSNNVIRFALNTRNIIPNFPMRRSGFHLCSDDLTLQSLMALHKMLATRDTRLHGRSHFGSEMEIRYALMTFGISMGSFVDDLLGEFSQQRIGQYVEQRRQLEAEREQQRCQAEAGGKNIEYPTPRDVLVGRGRPYRDHSGNTLLADIVAKFAGKYSRAESRSEKTAISFEIYQCVHDRGGRFLKRCEDGWEVVDEQVAREKVSKAVRYEVRQRLNEEEKDGASPAGDEFGDPQLSNGSTRNALSEQVQANKQYTPSSKKLRSSLGG